MENGKHKSITFEVKDGPWPYTLTYDFNVIADSEPVCDINLLNAIAAPSRSASQYRGLVFALLRPANPMVTLAEAGSLIEEHPRAVGKAFSALLAELGEGSEEDGE